MLLLAIESSCDDTSVAVLKDGLPLANVISSQKIHSEFGGVVPEMASREHQKNIVAVCQWALEKSAHNLNEMDFIAFTKGPGLPGSLLVGASFAKGLALGLNVPLISVNHLEAHVLSLFLENEKPNLPFVCLVVSGGHTLLILVKDWDKMEVLGSTQDDSVGEAFDKCAKLLGLGYPGGKAIDDLAKGGNAKRFPFPIAKLAEYQFSYSGVKTSFLYFSQGHGKENLENDLHDVCASLQEALLLPLLNAAETALLNWPGTSLGIVGGVAANSSLRKKAQDLCTKLGRKVYFPSLEYCTDNAAMIGKVAHLKAEKGLFCPLSEQSEPRLKLGFG